MLVVNAAASFLLFLPAVVFASPSPSPASHVAKPKALLTGRFIHITDVHPDPYYVVGSSEDGACHSSKPKDADRAGYWGAPTSDCDAPLNLANATFDWLKANFQGEVDFVVWTGDNARHDLDNRNPRTMPEIFRLNRFVAERIRDTFGDVPVVASIGNNDIYPHNIMFPGPSTITAEFLEIWRHFIPESNLHTFVRGGYYSVPAIADHLLLISLNTLYMFDNNKAVDGCVPTDDFGGNDIDPGTEQLQWLEQQLLLARERGMQVWLTGHVPPTKGTWYPRCYARYGELVLSFHDTIVGNLFGHMNVDHFNLIHASDVLPSSSLETTSLPLSLDGPFTPFVSSSLADDLHKDYAELPRRRKTNLSDYHIVNVNPSVIPTYLPAVRIWQYNITASEARHPPLVRLNVTGIEERVYEREGKDDERDDEEDGADEEGEDSDNEDDEDEDEKDEEQEELDDARRALAPPSPPGAIASLPSVARRLFSLLPSLPLSTSLLRRSFSDAVHRVTKRKQHKKPKKGKKKHKKKKKHPARIPRYFDPTSPSCQNGFLSPLGYTQYYINLVETNRNSGYGPGAKGRKLLEARGEKGERPPPVWEIEYTSFNATKLARGLLNLADQPAAIPVQLLPVSIAAVVSSVREEDERDQEAKVEKVARLIRKEGLTPYELDDLTVGSWLKLARKLGKSKKAAAWKGYVLRMFVSSGEEG